MIPGVVVRSQRFEPKVGGPEFGRDDEVVGHQRDGPRLF
jgi:hypothetical protein